MTEEEKLHVWIGGVRTGDSEMSEVTARCVRRQWNGKEFAAGALITWLAHNSPSECLESEWFPASHLGVKVNAWIRYLHPALVSAHLDLLSLLTFVTILMHCTFPCVLSGNLN